MRQTTDISSNPQHTIKRCNLLGLCKLEISSSLPMSDVFARRAAASSRPATGCLRAFGAAPALKVDATSKTASVLAATSCCHKVLSEPQELPTLWSHILSSRRGTRSLCFTSVHDFWGTAQNGLWIRPSGNRKQLSYS